MKSTQTVGHIRKACKEALGDLLWPVAGRTVSKRLIQRERGLILMFHYLDSPILPGVSEDLFLSREEFARILDFVREHLCPMDPENFLTGLQQGTLPPGATLLTFDDCADQAIQEALPELVSRKMKACWFANPGLIEAARTVPALELMHICRSAAQGFYELAVPEPLLVEITDEDSRGAAYRKLWPHIITSPSTYHPALFFHIRRVLRVYDLCPEAQLAPWKRLDDLRASGQWIGNHTLLHSTVHADGIDQFTADVAEAFRILEERFGTSRRLFCYPYGRTLDATPATTESLRRLGTEFGFVTQGGIACAGETGVLCLRREEASYSARAVKLAPLLGTIR